MNATVIQRISTVVGVVVLVSTAALKALSLVVPVPAPVRLQLSQSNFVLPFLTERAVLLLGIGLEAAFVALLVSSRSDRLKFGGLLWLSAVFAVYQHLTVFLGGRPCHCLGVWQNLSLAAPRATLVASLVLFLCACTGLAATWWGQSAYRGELNDGPRSGF
jgi:hypothetical protein